MVPRRRVDGSIVGHGVAAIVVPLAPSQERHHVQVAHAELVQQVEVLEDAGQVLAEAVRVADVADLRLVLERVGPQAPAQVQQAQRLRPVPVVIGHQRHQVRHDGGQGVRAVGPTQPVQQVVPVPLEAEQEEIDVARRHRPETFPDERLDRLERGLVRHAHDRDRRSARGTSGRCASASVAGSRSRRGRARTASCSPRPTRSCP